jgi:hypothetical protein
MRVRKVALQRAGEKIGIETGPKPNPEENATVQRDQGFRNELLLSVSMRMHGGRGADGAP